MADTGIVSDDIFERLSGAFNKKDIHWRIGATNKRAYNAASAEKQKEMKREGMPLAYIDARDVMDRLDEVLGPENWTDSYQEFSGRVICSIGVRTNGEWVYKSDGAGDTDVEGAKGGLSDAFKRAGVKHGIGRYLYGCKTPWIELTDRWEKPKNYDGSAYLPGFASKVMKTRVWNSLRDAAAEGNAPMARETWNELNNDQQSEVWRELSSGQRAAIKILLEETT